MGEPLLITNANLITGFSAIPNSGIYVNENGWIEDVFKMSRLSTKNFPDNTETYDAEGSTVTPGLIDTHIHGCGGYGTEDMTASSILGMSETLVKHGVTSFLPTIYPDGEECIFRSEDAILKAMGKEEGAKVLGINVEGPFISPKRPGALPASSISPVDIDYFDRIIEHGKGHVVCMTVAPELKHMHALALRAVTEGVVLLAGHTDSSYENMIEGMQCGILHSTHFFNAMSRLHHRNPGAVGAILINPHMACEVIADGVHVHPELVKLLVNLKPAGNIVLITDSLKPTEQKEGPLTANGVEVVLSDEGAFVSREDESLLNGSALTLNKALYNMQKWGVEPDVSVQMATANPARIYGFNSIGSLIPGKKGDICVFNSSFEPKAVFVDGQRRL
ncbi:MAG: N-acetylglucosamine-6-phosphate deacetylase [Sphaerochaetaceae bacterium]|nr:N-acetylglucosamine-6-phosphate deacetylase [Sphaerochaetaceae bacterium]